MAEKDLISILREQLILAGSAAEVLRESYGRAQAIFRVDEPVLTAEQRETLEALTARFSRLADFLTQRVFRTIDEIEMSPEGSLLDRLNRFEKRGIIESAQGWREIRDLRNEIAHAVREALRRTPELFSTYEKAKTFSLNRYKIAL